MNALAAGCAAPIDGAGEGVAAALSAVDCMTQRATASGFGHLLGPQGVLLPVLTALLTLYIGFFALALLTGRSRLTPAALAPRVLTLGLVLTFATSWVAYENVVWNLAARAPDAIAGALTGDRGSAAQAFAGRVDALMAALGQANDAANEAAAAKAAAAQAATQAGGPAPAAAVAPASPGGVSPGSMLWFGAAVLLLGTVGVLVTARIILALLLALGPAFVVLALFPATRGLFAGWARALVLAALTPLLVVLGGGFTLVLAAPAVARLVGPDGLEPKGAMAFFVLACVHACLMAMALRTAAVMVSGWRIFGRSAAMAADGAPSPGAAGSMQASGRPSAVWGRLLPVGGAGTAALTPAAPSPGGAGTHSARTNLPSLRPAPSTAMPPTAVRSRAGGIGSAFRAPPRARRLR